VFDCSLPLAADRAEEVALSSLADEKRVGSLLRNTARRWGWGSLRSRSLLGTARDPVRVTTTAADPKRDARAAQD
jgi:hypothetical protein